MKKVCFLVPKDSHSSIGFKLFLEQNYGQTDVVEWELLYENTAELHKIIEKSSKKYSAIYKINQSQEIVSRVEDDYVVINEKNNKLIDNCRFLQCKNIKINNRDFGNNNKTSQIINIYYQKTFDFNYDYDRLLTDFESIINQEVKSLDLLRISEMD